MIAKCITLLAIVAQINAYVCNTGCASGLAGVGAAGLGVAGVGAAGLGVAGVGAAGLGVAGVGAGLGVAGLGAGLGVGGVGASRNIVARGKYPVVMNNIGPIPDPRIPVTTSHAQAPLQVKPTVRLPTVIPAPRTVSHCCTCQKTILRPRVHDQVISVPSVQRYIETTHTPVVENIHYEAVPVNGGVGAYGVGAGLAGVGIGGLAGLGGVAGVGAVSGVAGVGGIAGCAPVASAVPVSTVGAYGAGSCLC